MRAIRVAIGLCEDPLEFPEYVRKILQEWGFSTQLVSDRRVWRLYEEMVRRRFIPDSLGVMLG